MKPDCCNCGDHIGVIKHRGEWYCVECFDLLSSIFGDDHDVSEPYAEEEL